MKYSVCSLIVANRVLPLAIPFRKICAVFILLISLLYHSAALGQSDSWSSPILLNVPGGEVRGASIAAARDGRIYVVWHCKNQPPSDMKAQLFLAVGDSTGWQPAVAITDTGRMDWTPDIAVDTASHPHVVWGEYSSGDVFYRWFNGNAWSIPLNLSNNPGGSFYPRLAIDHANRIHVAWHDEESGDWRVYYRMFDGSAWSQTQAISESLYAAAYPCLSVGRDDAIHLVFWSATPPRWYNDIFYRRVERGTWSQLSRITSDSLESHTPDCAITSDGRPVIVWSQYLGTEYTFPPNNRILSREFHGGEWGAPVEISDLAESDRPDIVIDARDRWHVVWQHYLRGEKRAIIFYARREDSAWTEEVDLSGVLGSISSGEANLCLDSTGNLHVVWMADDMGVHYRRRDAILDAVENDVLFPDATTLFPNYPNPFNAKTVIRFTLSERQEVSLKVFDLLGRELCVMVSGEREAGSHSVTFEGKDLPSGMYFYQLRLPVRTVTRAMLLIR